MRAPVPAIAAAAVPVILVLLATPPRADLEVAVPPGSPLAWIRSFPASRPSPGPLFPKPSPTGEDETPRERESAAVERPGTDAAARVASGVAPLRITTWDLAGEVGWVPRAARPYVASGDAGGAKFLGAPAPGYGMYWTSITPLLRLMLHRSQVTEPEVVAHLVEIGDPVRLVLDAAATENSLRGTVATLRELLGEPSKADAAELLGDIGQRAATRDELLERFVREELLRFHPYDPEGAFGERLFLFGDDLEPFVRRFARAPERLLARNAVAALGRYDTRSAHEALLAVAADTTDAVVLARALSALSGLRGADLDLTPLVERLDRASDDWEVAALVNALARSGAEAVAPHAVVLGERGMDHDSDLTVIALSALARLRHRTFRDEVTTFVERTEKRARSNPRAFRPSRGKPSARPDFPDPTDARGRLIVQLCTIVRATLDSLDGDVARELVELSREGDGDRGAWREGAFANTDVSRLLPPARFLYLEALARTGGEGLDVVRRVADGLGTEPMLRAAATSLLPHDERTELALAAVGDRSALPALRAFALELLVQDRHPAAAEAARALAVELAGLEPGSLDVSRTEERALYLRAIRTLDARGWLRAGHLLPLLDHVRASRPAGGAPRVVAARVADLVELVAGGAPDGRVRDALDALFHFAILHQVGPRVAADPDGARRRVEGQLEGLDDGDRDAEYEALVRSAIVELLLGRPVAREAPAPAEAIGLTAPVPLEEEILLALGKVGGPEVGEALVPLLDDPGAAEHRAALLLALGRLRAPASYPRLARELLAERPFERLCAYEALRHLSGEDRFADWFEGGRGELARAAESYWAWAVEAK